MQEKRSGSVCDVLRHEMIIASGSVPGTGLVAQVTRPHRGCVPTKYQSQHVWHVNVHMFEGSQLMNNLHIAWCKSRSAGCDVPRGSMICLYISDTAGRRASRANVILDSCYNRIDPNELYGHARRAVEGYIGQRTMLLTTVLGVLAATFRFIGGGAFGLA